MENHLLILTIVLCSFFPKQVAAACISFEECLKMAGQGNAQAQLFVADDYHLGTEKTEQNFEIAYSWYYKSAMQGNAQAQFAVGAFLDNGDGVEKDPVKAFVWYYLAAQQGDYASQEALGDYYYEGLDIPKDLIIAYAWFYVAGKNGSPTVEGVLSDLRINLTKNNKFQEAENLANTYHNLYSNLKK